MESQELQGRRVLRWCASIALLAVTGCDCAGPPVEKGRFACRTFAQCLGGFACVAGECREAPGCSPSAEECADLADNDCDALTDCADEECAGLACNLFGKRCEGDQCRCFPDAGTSETAEQSCGDGADNDCDGTADCAD